jgi:segment polarity protein dishevelled
MEETKIIYHLDDQDTPYLVKLPIAADKVTLLDLKNALNRQNYKYYFKSMDDDFGVVKEEILDDNACLPSFNGRVVTWLVSAEGSSVSDTKSQGAAESVNDVDVADKSTRSADSGQPSCSATRSKPPTGKPDNLPAPDSKKSFGPSSQRQQYAPLSRPNGSSRSHDLSYRARHGPASSVMSSDIETTSFVDSDDESRTRMSTTTGNTSEVSSHYNHRRRRRKHRMPVMSHASSISSITDSTMSLHIITVVLNMDTANFLGISIVGQSNKAGDGGIYVGSIMKGGAVALDGRIEPGDMILEVNGVSFERMSNDDAVRTLREAVQRPGPITLVVAKCWDPNPKGYFTIPRQEPVRPIDPSAWVNHMEAMRGMGGMWGRTGAPSMSTVTSTSSSLISSLPANEYLPPRRNHSSATSSSSHSSKSYTDMNLTKHSDMAAVVRVMAQPDSGLEVRDRMWLKITIPQAFIGSELVDWLYSHVDGFVDRRDARRYACNLLKAGFIQHTVNKLTFSEQCYYIFDNNVCKDISALSLEDIDSISSIGQRERDTVGQLPTPLAPAWGMPYAPSRPYTPSYLPPPPPAGVGMNYGPPATPYNYVNDSVSYVSMPGMTGAESIISGSAKRDRTCACIVSHTYKQIRNLWDNDKANPNQKAMRMVGKFDADIDRSTSSDTGSSDSENGRVGGGGKRDGADRKAAGPSVVGGPSGDPDGLRSRQLPPPPVDRGLPKPPAPPGRNLETVNPEMNASRQSFRLAMGNTYADDTLQVMGDL